MFHLTEDQITKVLNEKAKGGFSDFFAQASRFRKEYKPLFFTPYRSLEEFQDELAAPIIDPISLGFMSLGASLVAAVTASLSLAGLLVSSTLAFTLNNKVQNDTINLARNTAIMAGVMLTTAVTCFLLAVISIPYGVLSLMTRSVASLLLTKEEEESTQLSEYGFN